MQTVFIKSLENSGYKVIVIDSMSHEWIGQGGLLEIWSGLGNRQTDWKELTPRHNKFIETILQSDAHIITTLRSRAEYQAEQNEKGKLYLKKIGSSPQQRDGLDFEMTAMLSLNENHYAQSDSDKTHLFDGLSQVIDENTAKKLIDWLNTGEAEEKKTIITEDKKESYDNVIQFAIDELKSYMEMFELPESAQRALEKEIEEGKITIKRIEVYRNSCEKHKLKPRYMASEEEILIFLNGLSELDLSGNKELLCKITELEKSMEISKSKLKILQEESAKCPKLDLIGDSNNEPSFTIPDQKEEEPLPVGIL